MNVGSHDAGAVDQTGPAVGTDMNLRAEMPLVIFPSLVPRRQKLGLARRSPVQFGSRSGRPRHLLQPCHP